MVIRDKAYLKNKFKTGDIPTGQDFADFIDTFVASLDDKTPDSQGNVESYYRIIDPIDIDQPPIVYPEGTTEFYVDYDPNDFEDYLDEYPSAAIIPEGKLCVRTFNVNGTVSQQVDNSKDGIFKAAYARVCEDANTWGPIIELGNGSAVNYLQKPITSYHYSAAPSNDPLTEFTITLPDYSEDNDEYYINVNGRGMIPKDSVEITVDGSEVTFELLNGWTYNAVYRLEIVRLQYSIGDVNIVSGDIVDNLNTTDSTKALSANMGNVLKEMIEEHLNEPATAEEFGHVKVDDETIVINNDGVISAVSAAPNPALLPKATTTIEGIVQLTNTLGTSEILAPTQKILNDVSNSIPTLYTDLDEETTGKALDATQGKALRDMIEDNKVIVENILTSTSGVNALSANMGNSLYRMTNEFYDELILHVQEIASTDSLGHVIIDGDTIKRQSDTSRIYVPKASATQLGAIKVDGTTIKVTDGVIRADHTGLVKKVEGLSPDANGNVDIPTATTTRFGKVMLNDTLVGTSTTQALTANQGRQLKVNADTHEAKKATTSELGHVKVDGTTITANDGTISVPNASLTSRGVVQLYNSITSDSTVAATPSAVNSAIIAHSDVMSSTTVLGHVKVDGTTITSANGVISAVPSAVPDATTSVKGIVQLASSVNNATTTATTPAAVQNAINAHVSIIPTTSIRGHVKSDGVSTTIDATGTIKAKTKLNRIWDSRPILANATTWTVDFSDETALTDLNNYWFEVYDDGILVFGNPITYVVDNTAKTVTFTPQTPMGRAFTITCIGRGMEF